MTNLLRPARIALTAAALLLPALCAHAQVTALSAGGIEVREFLARGATSVYAAAYGAGLWQSNDTGATFPTRHALPGNARYLTGVSGNASTTIAVSGEEGLFTSTDGTNFTQRLFEPVSAVLLAAGNSGIVLAGSKGVGILRSTDGGVNWAAANNSTFTSTDVTAFAAHPSTTNNVYVAMRPNGQGNGGGIYSSSDGGASWTLMPAIPGPAAPNFSQVYSLTVDSAGAVFAAVLSTDGQGGVFKSTGGAWTQQGNTFGNVSVHRDANAGTTIWSGALRLGLQRSIGGGDFLAVAPDGSANPNFFYTAVNAVATFPGSATTLMAIKGGGIYRATAPANFTPAAWSRVPVSGADRILSASGDPTNGNSILFGLHAGGVWRSNTAGNATATFFAPTVSAAQADFSTNPGATAVNTFTSIRDLAATTTGVIYASVGNTGMHYANDNPGLFRFSGGIWRGVQHAVSAPAPWNIDQEINSNPSYLPIYGVTVHPTDNEMLHIGILGATGSQRRIAGPTWQNLSTAPIRRFVPSASGARVLALTMGDKPRLSTSSGSPGSYSTVGVSQTGFNFLMFYAAAENPNNANNWVGATNKGVFRSSDAGANWTRVAANFAHQAITAVGFKPDGSAFVGTWSGHRYCSADGGVSWTQLTAGTAQFNAGINAIRLINGQIYYLTDGAGAYRENGSC